VHLGKKENTEGVGEKNKILLGCRKKYSAKNIGRVLVWNGF